MSQPKYRIKYVRDGWFPWGLYPPNSPNVLGFYSSHAIAVRVMDAHARGADCQLFLKGYCNCQWECAQ